MDEINANDARAALLEIDGAAQTMRRNLVHMQLGENLMIWGMVWTLAYGAGSLSLEWLPWVWMFLIVLGVLGTVLCAVAHHRRPQVKSAKAQYQGRMILVSWAVLTVWVFLMGAFLPLRGKAQTLFFVSSFMLGYILQGLWLKSRLLMGIGLGVMLLTAVAFILLEGRAFQLHMSLVGLLGLVLPGLYIKLRWA